MILNRAKTTACWVVLLSACSLLPVDLAPDQGGLPTETATQVPPTVTPLQTTGEDTPTPLSPVTTATQEPPEDQGESLILTPEEAPPAAPSPTVQIPPFIVQPGTPIATRNFAHPELGCDWLGVAGQVFETSGQPVQMLVVELGGNLAGGPVDGLSLTGIAPFYGQGGYEITLNQRPLGSSQSVWVQLRDLAGNPLSDKIFIDTFNDCLRNLVLVNFIKLPEGRVPGDGTSVFLPLLLTEPRPYP